MWKLLSDPFSWISFITLVLIEVILGIDNILILIFLSEKLPRNQQKKSRRIGLFLSMIFRIIFLFSISWILKFKKPWFYFRNNLFKGYISSQNIILLFGGLFLIYKSIQEIRYKVINFSKKKFFYKKSTSFKKITIQIILLDIIFSIDSLLTAISLINIKNSSKYIQKEIFIIIFAIITTIGLMLFFSRILSNFIYKHSSLQILGFYFLMLIGLILISEAAEQGKWSIKGNNIKSIPKGYLYFTIFFTITIELFFSKFEKYFSSKSY